MNIEIPDKNCEGNCRYTIESETTTLVAYTPVYDKNGNPVNPDPNTIYGKMFCSTCNRLWSYKKQYGKCSFEEPRDLTSSLMSGTIECVDNGEGYGNGRIAE